MKKILLSFFTLAFLFLIPIINGVFAQSSSAIDPLQLATCLTEKKFVMYGRAGCSSCALEKEFFGQAFSGVNYVDCNQNADTRSLCDSKNIKAYPTWEDGNGKQYKGAIPLEKLGDISGCQAGAEPFYGEKKVVPDINVPDIEIPKIDVPKVNYLKEYWGVFAAGIVSFFAPCLIPLLPTYLSIISGYTFAELYGLEFSLLRGRVFRSSLFFGLGFAFVFTLLGATGSIVGIFINNNIPVLLRLSGVVMVFLGLVQLKIIKLPSWEFDYAWVMQRRLAKLGFFSASVIGAASALCWIPCIGPILAGVLLLAGNSNSVLKGMSYLFVYSLGIMFPFLIASLFFPRFFDKYRENRGVLKYFSLVSGIIIIAFGVILIANKYGEFLAMYEVVVKSVFK